MDQQLKKMEQDCDRLNQELATLQSSIPVSKAVKSCVARTAGSRCHCSACSAPRRPRVVGAQCCDFCQAEGCGQPGCSPGQLCVLLYRVHPCACSCNVRCVSPLGTRALCADSWSTSRDNQSRSRQTTSGIKTPTRTATRILDAAVSCRCGGCLAALYPSTGPYRNAVVPGQL